MRTKTHNKRYMIRYGNFGNIYDLAWADTEEDNRKLAVIGFEHCSRKWAERKARDEIDRRAMNPAFSGYASRAVYPAIYYLMGLDDDPETYLVRNYKLKGVIWE